MFNEFEKRHREYRSRLQGIIDRLKEGNTNVQKELLDLDWGIKNDLYRLEIIGNDAFEDEQEDLLKFVPVIDVIKQKYKFNYQIDESTFDDFEDEDDICIDDFEQEEFEDDIPQDYEGEMIEGEITDLFPDIEDDKIYNIPKKDFN